MTLTNFALKMARLSCRIVDPVSVVNCMFLRRSVLVLRSDAAVVYSQERHAKKNPKIASWEMARRSGERHPLW